MWVRLEPFDGSQNVSDFFKDLQRYLSQTGNTTDQEKLDTLISHISGEAKALYRTLETPTFDTLKSALEERFGLTDQEKRQLKSTFYSSWSRSVWLFCLDITYGQSREGHVFDHVTFWLDHVSWSDRCVHGLNMTRCIEQYKSQLQADHDLASCDRFIRYRSLAPALTATCPLFPCMSVGHACRQCWCACDDSTI